MYSGNKDFSPIFSGKSPVLKLTFLAFPGGPGGFRKVREAGRNHFHLSWYLLVPGARSYRVLLPRDPPIIKQLISFINFF